MEQIIIPAHAKVNLTLDILNKRQDGYHDLETLMQQVALKDEVTITVRNDKSITISCDHPHVPTGDKNIAYKAARQVIREYNINFGVDIFIKKRIPVEGGMAGGSTDAAAVLKGMNQLFSLNMSQEKMAQIGLQLGADVPFCIIGQTSIARGVGEILTPVSFPPKLWIVLVKPDFGVSTAQVYKNFNMQEVTNKPNLSLVLKGIKEQSISFIYEGLGNVLEPVTLSMYPVLSSLKGKMHEWGAETVLMSGSGPTICSFVGSLDEAENLSKKAKGNLPSNYQIVVTHTIEDN